MVHLTHDTSRVVRTSYRTVFLVFLPNRLYIPYLSASDNPRYA
jgi:hypothetical protein